MNKSSQPNWYKMLPEYMKPEENKIEELEEVRTIFHMPHDLFSGRIGISSWVVRKVQEEAFRKFKKEIPNATDKELWRAVLLSRLEVKIKIPDPNDLPMDVLLDKIKNLDNIMVSINTFDELVDYVLVMDLNILKDSDFIQRKIDSILLGTKLPPSKWVNDLDKEE